MGGSLFSFCNGVYTTRCTQTLRAVKRPLISAEKGVSTGADVIKRIWKRKKMGDKIGRNSSGRFTKGNNFGDGKKNEKYKKVYTDQIIDYFSSPPTRVEYIKHYDRNGDLTKEEPVVVGADYPTFEGFAIKIGVTARTLENWAKKYPTTFGVACERAKDMQKNMIIVNGLGGRYNSKFAQFIASSQFDMAEKSEKKLSTDEGWEVNINVKTADQS